MLVGARPGRPHEDCASRTARPGLRVPDCASRIIFGMPDHSIEDPFVIQILLARQQGVSLAFDIASVFAAEALVFLSTNLIKRFTQVTHNMKLVIEDQFVGGILQG